MKNFNFKLFFPHVVAIAGFLVISVLYFYPLFQGKVLKQGDIIQFRGMAQEIADFRERTGKEALWTNSMFGGMPAFQISVLYHNNLARYIDSIISFDLPVPARYLFLSLVGFYILLLAFRVDPWLSIVGALAFAFSTYFFIIEVAGHNSKAHAMTFMAPIIAGIILSFRGKLFLGAVLTGLFLSLQLFTNHLQITYYTLIIVVFYGLFELITFIKEKKLSEFIKIIWTLLIPVVLAIGMNISNLWLTLEYTQYSTRGGTELTHQAEIVTTGLDKDYILNDYSYGIAETFNLLIPDFKGRSSTHNLGRESEVFRVLQEKRIPDALAIAQTLPTYWGAQVYTAGPVYIGATVIFLFIFGLLLLKGNLKWWILSVTILAIMLAWGKHLFWFSEFFINYVPGYNKFRTVSMILVIPGLTIPFFGLMAIAEMLKKNIVKQELFRALKYSFLILGGIALAFTLIPGAFLNFSGGMDNAILAAGYPQFIIDALMVDREVMLKSDAFRSFVFITLTAGLVYLFYLGKIKPHLLIIGLGVLFLADLGPISRRFLNADSYVSKNEKQQIFQPSQIDLEILKDKDPNFRVFNLTRNPFNDAVTSFWHKSIGGYHGAKMGRYQDVIEFYLSKVDPDVLNMLNTKYIITAAENQTQPVLQINPGALGHAWFVDRYILVENADAEIEALADFNPATEMIVDKRIADLLPSSPIDRDTLAAIKLESYSPNHLVYSTISATDQLAVFSEIFYSKGWEVTVSGKATPHFRVNYILRGMVVPAGNHTIEFKFRPDGFFVGERIALASSIVLILLVLGSLFLEVRKHDFFRK